MPRSGLISYRRFGKWWGPTTTCSSRPTYWPAAPPLGAAGIGDGRSAFSFDGGDYVTIYTTKLASELNLAKGSVLIWVKMASAAVWADGTERAFVSLRNAAFAGMI